MTKKYKKLLLVSCLVSTVTFATTFQFFFDKEFHWNWDKVNLSDSSFWNKLNKTLPIDFKFGVAASAFQLEGAQTINNQFCENNWTRFHKDYESSLGIDHWNQAETDAQLIANLGVDSYRFSIDWSKVEPEKGTYNRAVLNHYIQFAKALKRLGVEPIVCLFHFTVPTWFEDEGGFEKTENNAHFVNFCNYVFDNLDGIVTTWMTYNEPIAYALEGYFRGKFPPAKQSFVLAGQVYCNMLNAHVEIYKNFKAKNPTASVGLVMMFHPLDPYGSNPIEQITCTLGNHLLHEITTQFFKTGSFNWFYVVRDTNKDAPTALDFIGVNYYRHAIYRCQWWPFKVYETKRDNDECAPDNGKIIYPEGLYRSIVNAAQYGVPIYVTENGIADSIGSKRNEFLKKHLFAVQKAINDGYDVRGYTYWAVFDTIGWHPHYQSRYGLYAVDFTTYKRTLRESAKPFVQFLKQRKQA